VPQQWGHKWAEDDDEYQDIIWDKGLLGYDSNQ
jgi:hypothetical protein